MDAHIRKIERREWWLWTSAILVTLLLTLGIVSFLVPILHPQVKAADPLPVNNAMRDDTHFSRATNDATFL